MKVKIVTKNFWKAEFTTEKKKILSIFLVFIVFVSFSVVSLIDLFSRIENNSGIFISTWDTTRTSSGSSGTNQVKLPLNSEGTYNFVVEWGDGSSNTITKWNQSEVIHTYISSGVYSINIIGRIIGWRFAYPEDRLKILEIQQWGCLRLGNSGGYFNGCSNLKITSDDILDLTGTTTLYAAFRGCTTIDTVNSMNKWDVSRVTDMGCMFYKAYNFNQDIGNWKVSRVTDMGGMFYGTYAFNQDIGNWDVSHVTEMGGMFYNAYNFNQDIGNWKVSRVTDMGEMFYGASAFNQDLGNWDVSRVTDMGGMFYDASAFNQDLGNWDVSSVTGMNNMFALTYLSTTNYDNLLIGWSHHSLKNGVYFDGGYSQYSSGTAATARQKIIDNYGWSITDGGQI
ncbi:MAG: BspA family leucine-rich repeat surface protein [Promethearchaeota archaeon]|nr:MAG: BspA family leucine-rich repeat surface protein [Candidatus Lokiarchaeota archaeon]